MTNTTNRRDSNVNERMSDIFHGGGFLCAPETWADGSSIHDLPWSPYGVDTTDRVVVLLMDLRSVSAVSIMRAARISGALRAKLHVVLGISKASLAASPALVVPHITDLLRANAPRKGFELEVVDGNIQDRAADIARDETAMLVVVDARLGARFACDLCATLEVPVLLARDARPNGELIGVSDMRHLRFPVLEAARAFGRALDRRVTYFHNAKPAPVFLADPMAGASSYLGMLELQDDAVAAKRARLSSLGGGTIESIVSRAGDTVDAALELARARDADMLVVGYRPHSWLARLLGHRTSESLIERSRRSVLVVPVVGRA